ncbi:MAG: ATP-binding cassette domain-containing protein [Chrysiogenia bacterium]
MDILQAEDLWVECITAGSRQPVLRGISLNIPYNQVTVLLGESGAGKTILARALSGLLPDGFFASRGRILFGGQVMSGSPAWALVRGRKIFYTPQNAAASLNPVLTIGRQIRETSRISAKELGEMLLRLQFADPEGILQSYPFTLSGGENQRCLLALALAVRPDVLILDEPTAEIDAAAQEEFIEVLRDYQRAHSLTVLLISHHLGFVKAIAQNLCVLSRGELIAAGIPRDIFSSPGHAYTREIADYLGTI